MFLVILFSILLLIFLSGVLGFLFLIYIPSLREQKINTSFIMFSKTEAFFSKEQNEDLNLKKAVVLPSEEKNVFNFNDYAGPASCKLFFAFYAEKINYKEGCIGFGDCIQSCPKQAITVRAHRAQIATFCNGCEACLDFCPKNFIKIIDFADSAENKKFFSQYGKSGVYKFLKKLYNAVHRK